MPTHIARLPFLCVVMGVLFAATGCKTTGKHVRWYDGPPAATNKIALLKVQRDIGTVILTVDKIDAQPLARGAFMGNDATEIELLPGQHDLEVSYRDSNDNHSTVDAKISFLAEPGNVYELHGAPLERSFGKGLVQTLTLQHWYWTVWIANADTHAVVAGTPRETPMHWYEK